MLSAVREQLPDRGQRPGGQLDPEADLGVLPAGSRGERRAREENLGARFAAAAVQRAPRAAGKCDGADSEHSAAQDGSGEDPEQRPKVLRPGILSVFLGPCGVRNLLAR